MSDIMLFGVLRMPYTMAMETEISRLQFYDRAQQAADLIDSLTAKLEDARIKLRLEQSASTFAKIERQTAESLHEQATAREAELREALEQIANNGVSREEYVMFGPAAYMRIARAALASK